MMFRTHMGECVNTPDWEPLSYIEVVASVVVMVMVAVVIALAVRIGATLSHNTGNGKKGVSCRTGSINCSNGRELK